jgi:hypothetical protein
LERRLCDAFDADALAALADAPRRIKTDPSPVILPWVASEWGLAGLVDYFPSLEDLIREGLPWLMERGTPAVIERVLGWIGLDGVIIEEDGARLSIDPGRIPNAGELTDIVYLVNLSIPAHVDLYRLFHGWDLRPIGVSMPEAIDNGLLDDDSGVWANISGEDVKLSFGMTHSAGIADGADERLGAARDDIMFAHITYNDRLWLSAWELDSEIVRNVRMNVEHTAGRHADGAAGRLPTGGARLTITRAATDLARVVAHRSGDDPDQRPSHAHFVRRAGASAGRHRVRDRHSVRRRHDPAGTRRTRQIRRRGERVRDEPAVSNWRDALVVECVDVDGAPR